MEEKRNNEQANEQKTVKKYVNINTITAVISLNANGLKTQLKTEWIKRVE